METGTAAATGSVTEPPKSLTQTPAQRVRLTDPVTRATLRCPQMIDLTRQRASRWTLWVTLLALLLVAMTSTVEVQTCVGACGEPVAVERACCSNEPAPDLDASCCGCCDEPADEAPFTSHRLAGIGSKMWASTAHRAQIFARVIEDNGCDCSA